MKRIALLTSLAMISTQVIAADRIEVRDDDATYVYSCPLVVHEETPGFGYAGVVCTDTQPTVTPAATAAPPNVRPDWQAHVKHVYSGPYVPAHKDWEYCRLVSYELGNDGKNLIVDCRVFWTPPPPAAARKKAR